jgi:hypothetical protein
MDCNGCKHLNITESEQRKLEKGNHIPHVCTLYDKQVFHYGNRMMGYDPYIITPCKECEEHIENTLENVARITNTPYEDVEKGFNKLLEKLKNG